MTAKSIEHNHNNKTRHAGLNGQGHYLGGVEVDIFGTAMFIPRHGWLVIESLFHIQSSQLILKKKTYLSGYSKKIYIFILTSVGYTTFNISVCGCLSKICILCV